MAKAGAATVAAADVELRNARIAPWLGVPRGPAVVTDRGRQPARRGRARTGGGVRALAVARAGAATVAAADVEPRNACIAPRLGFRAGRRSRRFAGGGPRGDGMGKPVAVFERRRWPGRAPRRWRRPTSSCAMRALRPGWMFRAGRRSRRFAGGGPRGDGLGKPVAAFVRWW
ncbi:hypothetical protein [Burkholderia gladioli]|uniref:hypothetical protein n=1 Tax=Burkholderia gladioli TaxID=28095 RepID=UPI001640431F|nr:hypothetical protein [Burkholderia gladioli]